MDINALRALSVVAVVGYHLQVSGFAGGFAGVDVFLVITGYLMTAKVMAYLAKDRFTFADFMAMRARRIFPALAVVVAATVIADSLFTLPREYEKHLLQALSALTFVSNFAFDYGYFASDAQTKPLLHTWSLSVEWQFYIWMPIIVWLIWQRTERLGAVTIAFMVFAIASFTWCLWESHADATQASFYSLRARAWEPLIGGLIALAELHRWKPLNSKWLAVPGWALVAGCAAYPIPKAHWPGIVTVFPIIGAGMIIAARQEGQLLCTAPIQRLGDWSYSIYLWHWPIWVFAIEWLSIRGYSVNAEAKALIVIASVVAAYASYRWLEQPVRMARLYWTPRRLWNVSGAMVGMLVGFIGLAFWANGFPGRLPTYLLPAELARATDTPRDECFRNANSIKSAPSLYCNFGNDASPHSVMLWGDSFANQYLVPVTAAAVKNELYGLIATQSACRPFIDDPARNEADQWQCREFNRDTLEYLSTHDEPRIVVVGGNWSDAAEVTAVIDKLLSQNKVVVLILPLLDIGFDVPQLWIERQMRAGAAIANWRVKANPILTMKSLRDALAENLKRHSGDLRLIAVDPQLIVCPDGYCYLVRNGQSNFRDTAHISNANATQYAGLFDAALKLAVRRADDE